MACFGYRNEACAYAPNRWHLCGGCVHYTFLEYGSQGTGTIVLAQFCEGAQSSCRW